MIESERERPWTGTATMRSWWVPGAAGASLLGLGMGLGDLVTDEGARRTGELALDLRLAHHREVALTALARAVDLGVGTVMGPLVIVVVAITLWVRLRRPGPALSFVAVAVLGWTSVALGKLWYARPRPSLSGVPALVSEMGRDGFPSGHTALVASVTAGLLVALTMAGRRLRVVWLLGGAATALTAATRLYLGAHYLGDVVASPVVVAGTTLCLVGMARLCGGRSRRLSAWFEGLAGQRAGAETVSPSNAARKRDRRIPPHATRSAVWRAGPAAKGAMAP